MNSTPEPSEKKDFTSFLRDLERTCQMYFYEKAPALPAGVREFIVQIAPYLTILGVILGALGLLALLGWSSFIATTYWAGGQYGFSFLVSVIALVATLILEGMAVPGLFHRKRHAWNLLFYATLIQSLENLLMLNVIGLVLGTLICLYVLFQVRPYYQ